MSGEFTNPPKWDPKTVLTTTAILRDQPRKNDVGPPAVEQVAEVGPAQAGALRGASRAPRLAEVHHQHQQASEGAWHRAAAAGAEGGAWEQLGPTFGGQ